MSATVLSIYPFFIRLAAGLAVALAVVLACGNHLPAQTPAETALPLNFPPLVEPPADPAAAEKIQRALQGGSSEQVPGGVLGEVIDIIRNQGSILDRSSLDPRMGARERGSESDDDISPSETTRSSVQAAESLLRSARLLELHYGRSAARPDARSDRLPISELVRQMRIQATRLLATEFPQASD